MSRTRTALLLAAVALVVPTAAALPAQAQTAPASSRITYVADVNGFGEVFAADANGRNAQQLTTTDPEAKPRMTTKCDPALSPDGSQVAYAANDGHFYVESATDPSALPVRITPEHLSYETQEGGRRPTWSQDGQRVYFHYTRGSMRSTAPDDAMAVDLWVAERDAAGTWAARPLTAFQDGEWLLHPRVSPTGDWLLYSYRDTPTTPYELYVVQVAALAGAPAVDPLGQRLTTGGSNALLASWAPSSTQIAFVQGCSGGLVKAPLTYDGGTWTLGSTMTLGRGSCGGAAWSRHSESLIAHSDGSKVYTLDVSAKRPRSVAIATGYMPGW